MTEEKSKYDKITVYVEKAKNRKETISKCLRDNDHVKVQVYCGGVLTYQFDIVSTHTKGDKLTDAGNKIADYRPVLYVNGYLIGLPINIFRIPDKFKGTSFHRGMIMKATGKSYAALIEEIKKTVTQSEKLIEEISEDLTPRTTTVHRYKTLCWKGTAYDRIKALLGKKEKDTKRKEKNCTTS